ncbi:MAG: prepilin-type N-terminal cleavage/methylation domain-containing protein [Campylobacterota bacterium]|nr:prepilin-type N-terminal cleavage/methylation domain-containing protein [Campylobacterota bacterium]
MRKGLTLIELIFSMLIIAIVFSVVPKIIFASNKSMASSMKEDALFNAYTLLGTIYRLPWDENTLSGGDILDTAESAACDNRRVGSFFGARNCKDSDESASAIGREEANIYNDIDDYFDYNEDVNVTDKKKYVLEIKINYVNKNYEINTTNTRERKEIVATISSHDDNKKMKGFQSSFVYHSANLGLIPIKKKRWR